MEEQKKEPLHDVRQLAESDEFLADRDIIGVVAKGVGVTTKSWLREEINDFRNREVV